MKQPIVFSRPVDRKTQANIVEFKSPNKTMKVYFSYMTPVGVGFLDHGEGRYEFWVYKYPSRTTARHLSEMDIRDWPETDAEGLRSKIAEGMAQIGLDLFRHRLAGGEL